MQEFLIRTKNCMATESLQQSKKYIFLDTCIFQYVGDKNKSKSAVVRDCLDGLVKKGFILAVSEITMFEHMHGLWGVRAEKAYNLLNVYEWKAITKIILLWATWLGGFYHDEKQDGIDVGDKIIAATAISEGGFVLTANHKDYPHPFFITVESYALEYDVSHYKKTLDVVLYKPNLELMARRLQEKEHEKTN